MSEHDLPIDTLQGLMHLANEPLKLCIHMLYQVNDSEEISKIAIIADALQEVATARINDTFRAIEEQVGEIRVDGVPEGFGAMQCSSRVTAVLKKPKKSE